MRILFPLFVIATLIEIYTIIQVGEVIGGFNTILLIIITAGIGSFLVKQQGLQTLQNAQMKVQSGQTPSQELAGGIIIFISGILLLTPGFITDGIGILGLIPMVRTRIITHFSKAFLSNTSKHFHYSQHSQRRNTSQSSHLQDDGVIDGEYWKND